MTRARNRSRIIDDLPKVEMEILGFLIEHGPATTRLVADGLAPQRQMGLGAAQAQLLRLEQKGLVARQKIVGRNAYRYALTNKVEPTYRRLISRMLDRLFAGNPVRLMATLLDSRPPNLHEIEQFEELIERAKKDATKRD